MLDRKVLALGIFIASLAAAVTLILAGQEELGSGVLAFALGLGMRSPFSPGAQPADEIDDDATTSPESLNAKRGER